MASDRQSSENIALTQEKYSGRGPITRFAVRSFMLAVKEMVGTVPFGSLLDAGCGEGVVLQNVPLDSSHLTLGIDLDRRRVQLAKEASKKASFVIADIHNLPLADRSIDLTLVLEVLEHVGDPDQALSEVHRVTRRYLLASVPNEPWWRLGNMARFKYLRRWGNTPEHIHHWTIRGFKRFIQRRFSILKVRTPFLWTLILAER